MYFLTQLSIGFTFSIMHWPSMYILHNTCTYVYTRVCVCVCVCVCVFSSEVARVIVEHEGWAECLKTCTRRDGVETTPFRRMIRKMPGTLHLQFTKVTICTCTCEIALHMS